MQIKSIIVLFVLKQVMPVGVPQFCCVGFAEHAVILKAVFDVGLDKLGRLVIICMTTCDIIIRIAIPIIAIR
jgi:hypothetical protein